MHKRRACHGARSAPWSAHSVVKHAQKSVCTNYAVPTGNLDSASGKEIMDIIKGLWQDGNTIVLITHDINVANQAERKVYVHDGKLSNKEAAV